MRRKGHSCLLGVLVVIVLFAGLFLFRDRGPIRDFKIYNPPLPLADVIEGKTFDKVDRNDPLETYGAFYLCKNMEELFSLYDPKDLEGKDRVIEYWRANPNWETPSFQNIPREVMLVFSFKYVGIHGAPEWFFVRRRITSDASQSIFALHGVQKVSNYWVKYFDSDGTAARSHVYKLMEEVGIYDKMELTRADIKAFRARLGNMDKEISQKLEVAQEKGQSEVTSEKGRREGGSLK